MFEIGVKVYGKEIGNEWEGYNINFKNVTEYKFEQNFFCIFYMGNKIKYIPIIRIHDISILDLNKIQIKS